MAPRLSRGCKNLPPALSLEPEEAGGADGIRENLYRSLINGSMVRLDRLNRVSPLREPVSINLEGMLIYYNFYIFLKILMISPESNFFKKIFGIFWNGC